MTISALGIEGVFLLTLQPLGDERGWFVRTFCEKTFLEKGLNTHWVQWNHSFSAKKGTVRGLHFQHPPFQEIKMVRCISGAVLDIIVDIRKDSETFLQHISVELSAENKSVVYIPKGFAHGFQTLTENAQLLYAHSNEYVKTAEGGLRYDDPALQIKWPLPLTDISNRDQIHPLLNITNFKGI